MDVELWQVGKVIIISCANGWRNSLATLSSLPVYSTLTPYCHICKLHLTWSCGASWSARAGHDSS